MTTGPMEIHLPPRLIGQRNDLARLHVEAGWSERDALALATKAICRRHGIKAPAVKGEPAKSLDDWMERKLF